MERKYKQLTTISILVLVTAASFGATWNNAGGDRAWSNPANWSPTTVPTSIDTAAVSTISDFPIITSNAQAFQIRVGATGSTSQLIINGGTLTVAEWLMMGTEQANCNGIVVVNGGSVTCGGSSGSNGHLWVGFSATGTLEVNSGSVHAYNMLGLGWQSSGIGNIKLNGGTVWAGDMQFGASGTGSGTVDLAGGVLILDGDRRTKLTPYISNHQIIAFGGRGTVKMDFGVTNANKTTLRGESDPTRACCPDPESGMTGVNPFTMLQFRAGAAGDSHSIYLGTDSAAVANASPETSGIFKGTLPKEVLNFDPSGLAFETVYYWRVDEVNESGTFKGDVWNFKTQAYAVIDDLESYSDSNAMLTSWSDGRTGSSGSVISLAGSEGISSSKALRFDYDNSGNGGKPFYSEASLQVAFGDWTVSSIKSMDIWYKGSVANSAVPMYIVLEDYEGRTAIVVNPDGSALNSTADYRVWQIDLTGITGVNIGDIKKMYIGAGSRSNPVAGGSGTVYVDDIQLHPSRCINKPRGDLNNDCVIDFADFALMGSTWLNRNTFKF